MYNKIHLLVLIDNKKCWPMGDHIVEIPLVQFAVTIQSNLSNET